jgi:hydroxymethylglutaryl-CoA lyase
LEKGMRVRGYVSVVMACPYSGKTDYKRVREVARQLIEMGCYEVSLGDTTGKGRPHEIGEMLEEVKKAVPVEKLAVSDSIFSACSAAVELTLVGTCEEAEIIILEEY